MPVSRRACLIGFLTILLSGCGIDYDTDDPDYGYFADLFAAARKQNQVADMERLNGGDWTTACIFGGYSKPLREMEALGATISNEDRKRIEEAATTDLRLFSVEESEMMVTYIDKANRAHFIHIRNGIGAQGQEFQSCVTRPETKIDVLGP